MAHEPLLLGDLPGRPVRSTGASVARVHRFGLTERRLHMVHGSAFLAMLATGLVLYLPFLAQVISARPLMKALHLTAAVAWLTALALIPLLGDRRALKRTRRDLERFDDDDLRWLRQRLPSRRARATRARVGTPAAIPQGRFNAGQKVHSVVQAALSVLFVVSGSLLWLGERNTSLRFPGTLALHDVAMYTGVAFVVGHVWMACSPEHRASLEGVTKGTVPAGYAASHHSKWVARAPAPAAGPHPGRARLLAAVLVVLIGLAGSTLLVRDVLHGENARPPVARTASPPA